ncbi:hypothetical protein BDR04DRAFT_1109048 [Suillus decipiens]|nr:hypothetical protein BDR04DRAFT_1109048 [Suillus decipiens]
MGNHTRLRQSSCAQNQLNGCSTILACGNNFNQGDLVAIPRASTSLSTKQGPLLLMDWSPLIICKVIFCYTQR